MTYCQLSFSMGVVVSPTFQPGGLVCVSKVPPYRNVNCLFSSINGGDILTHTAILGQCQKLILAR